MRLLKLLVSVFYFSSLPGSGTSIAQAIQNPVRSENTVKIGLIIPDNKSLAARNGAESAIRRANLKGGYNGIPFQLIVRSMEGPWGTGSKQAVDLIFEEKVWALLGSHDGRNAHLVEQAATKARIVFLSAWASDPTLSQAFVPWFFNCVPNDNQQADAMIEEIYNKRKFTNVAAISDNTYDSNLALKSFVKKAESSGKQEPVRFYYNSGSDEFISLPDLIYKANVNCIILFGQTSSSKKLIQLLRSKKIILPVFGTLGVLNENELPEEELKYFEGAVFVYSGNLTSSERAAFSDEFGKTYGKSPGPVAEYAYDAMNLIIEAIRDAGPDRDKIQKSLLKIHYEGLTGPIQFDEKGNRRGNACLIEIKNGVPVAVERDQGK
jgi:branched-chain amino acid transport system substrate-binding protein